MKNDLYNSSIYEDVEKRRAEQLKKLRRTEGFQGTLWSIQLKIKNGFETIFAGATLIVLIIMSLIPTIAVCLLVLALVKYLSGG